MIRGAVVFLALALGVAWFAWAQKADETPSASEKPVAASVDKPAAADADKAAGTTGIPDQRAAASAESPEAAKARFEKILTEWRELDFKLFELQEKFQIAPSDDTIRLATEYMQMVAAARQRVHEFSSAAEACYAADPKDQGLTKLLVLQLDDYLQTDAFEDAVRVAHLLISHGYDEKTVFAKAGTAAFATNDFASAREWLQRASDLGEIDRDATRMLAECEMQEQHWQHEQEVRKAEAEADDLPRVKLTTTKGDIVVELFENEAPVATANFIELVERHFYDHTKFHRVIGKFMAQGGDPQGNGNGGPGHTIPGEVERKDHRLHFRGSLSMAHAGNPNGGGSQFFITFLPTSQLDGRHTVFGRVIEGMDVVGKLEKTQDSTGRPLKVVQDEILSASVLRKRDHKYEAPKVMNP